MARKNLKIPEGTFVELKEHKEENFPGTSWEGYLTELRHSHDSFEGEMARRDATIEHLESQVNDLDERLRKVVREELERHDV